MHIVIDAPRWRIANVEPIVKRTSELQNFDGTITIDGEILKFGSDKYGFSIFEYEIGFIPDNEAENAKNRDHRLTRQSLHAERTLRV